MNSKLAFFLNLGYWEIVIVWDCFKVKSGKKSDFLFTLHLTEHYLHKNEQSRERFRKTGTSTFEGNC